MIKPTDFLVIEDHEGKNRYEGSPKQVVTFMAKSNFITSRMDDAPNVYMYVVMINLENLFDIKIEVEYEDFAKFIADLARLGIVRILERRPAK